MRALAIVLSVPHEPDLSWLMNKSAAAAGIKSNCGPLIEAARGGWGGGRHDPHAGRTRAHRGADGVWVHPWLAAVARERQLTARWEAIGRGPTADRHRAVLVCAYTEVRFPPETDRKLGALAAVALLTAAFREAYPEDEGVPLEWLARACSRPKDARLIESMRLQAGDLVHAAVDAWRASRTGATHEPNEDAARRAELAGRPVEGPERREPPRTWAPGERTPERPCRPTVLDAGATIVGRPLRRYDVQGSPLLRPRGWREASAPRGEPRANLCGGVQGEGDACHG